jgi:hypothetical protein
MQKATVASLIFILFCIGNVHAEVTDEYEDAGYGTGFFVSANGLIATCNHVVKGAELIQVEYKNKSYKAHIITTNEGNDLAIIKIEGEFPFFRLVESDNVKMGDDVYTVGYPDPIDQGIEPKLTTGTVSALSGIEDNPTYLQISVPIQPGNSGGPLITASGMVVGVISRTLDPRYTINKHGFVPQNVNYAVKAEYLKILLELAKKKLEENNAAQDEAKNEISSKEESAKKIMRIVLKSKKNHKRSEAIPKKTKRSSKSPQVWEEALNSACERETLIKVVQKINADDPFDNYDEIKNEFPPKFREWMDSWYQNTYAAWLSRGGGLAPGNIKGNPTPYEVDFKRLKNELSRDNPENLRGWIDALSYIKFVKSKITEKGYDLLIEQYPDEWKELAFNKEQDILINDLISQSKKEALSGRSFPCAEIIFHDSLGMAHTDPTISDNRLLGTKAYKQLNDPIDKNDKETTYLIISIVTKEPYLIKVPVSYFSADGTKKN